MTKASGKTIQMFLPDGNPRGVKIAEFTSRTIQVVAVPRAQLEFASSRSELRNVGIYFLFGSSENGNLPQLYIGEAEDCANRLKQHNKQKDWWTLALVCISKTAEFTKAHVKYLEWFCHQEAIEAGRYKLENGNIPPKAHLSEPVIADLMDHFETMRTLCSTLGYPLFDKIQKVKKVNRLSCKHQNMKAVANGEYTEEGLIVFAGSTAVRRPPTAHENAVTVLQEALLKDEVVADTDDGKLLLFNRDHVFNSPSQAASFVCGSSVNGWIKWFYPDGRTLDEVKRKEPESEH
ncbi:GIY-YIG nuclease family protein [Roseibacillus persicicus]|uniref:GIY-YIG nuclease family protein n=1 Tax=Roseibacillus persicicus TaxID=454148 RepID=UPI00280FF940|nr:GIY-YIG nuclease family protein [Roseibacillus persicicus]MDQ8192007.1 GIY-YIG nuclease family protein [Roseibacillus persicicus]